MLKAYYLHSDGYMYEIDGRRVRRVSMVTGEPKLSALWALAATILLWGLYGGIAFMMWSWLRAGGMQ